MKTKLLKFFFGTIFFSAIITGCNNTEEPIAINKVATVESSTFGAEYPFADTLRVYANDSTFVDVKISSNNEDALKSHLTKYSPYLKIFNGYENINTDVDAENNKVAKTNIKAENANIIRTEVINKSGNLSDYTIGYTQNMLKTSSGIQKAVIYPNLQYYEYISNVHDTYFKVKMWHVMGVELPTYVKFGYVNCWLCFWQTETGFFPYETIYWGLNVHYFVNPWANDGSSYVGRKYKLGVGIYSQTPDNHEVRYWTYPITNW